MMYGNPAHRLTPPRAGWWSVLLLALVCVAGPAAADEIVGGFGFDLGDRYDPDRSLSRGDSVSGDTYYLVNASEPQPPLETYGVHITPQSHQIAVVFGVAEYPTRDQCEAQRAIYRVRFTDRFGEPFRSAGLEGVMTFGEAPRYALLECKGEADPVVFQVSFVDVGLMRQFKQERDAEADASR